MTRWGIFVKVPFTNQLMQRLHAKQNYFKTISAFVDVRPK